MEITITIRRTNTEHGTKFTNTLFMAQRAVHSIKPPWDALLANVEVIVTDVAIPEIPELEESYEGRKRRATEESSLFIDTALNEENEAGVSDKIFFTSAKYSTISRTSMKMALLYQLARIMTVNSSSLRQAVEAESRMIRIREQRTKGVLIAFRHLLVRYFVNPKILKVESSTEYDFVKIIEVLIKKKKIALDA